MTAAPQPIFMLLPLESLNESHLNPRRAMDEAALADLAKSIATQGILEPLLVRSYLPNRYEVVAGARRLAAARRAGLDVAPCIVRDMTDAEVIEVALVENVMRADISALEEGDAYRRLQREHGYTIEKLCEKTGKSRTVVFQRLKLASLQGEPRKMLANGTLSASVAELVARLPTEKTQQDAIALLEAKKHYKFELSTLPFREAKAILDDELRLTLKAAPFDVKDAELLPEAGACGACPKRTGADREAFDVKDDTCLDGACWAKKKAAAFKALQAEAKAQGKHLEKAKGLFAPGYAQSKIASTHTEKYALPTDEVRVGDKLKKWQALFGEAELPTVVVLDEQNRSHVLVDKPAALELLKAKHPKLEVGGLDKANEDWRAQQQRAAEERERHVLVATSVRTSALASVKKLEDAVDLFLLSWASDDYQWRPMLKRAGLSEKLRPEKLTAEQKVKLLVSDAFTSHRADFLDAAAKRLGIGIKALKKRAEAHAAGTCFNCEAPTLPEERLCASCTGEDE